MSLENRPDSLLIGVYQVLKQIENLTCDKAPYESFSHAFKYHS